MSKTAVDKIPLCVISGCTGRRAAKGRRGKNSPLYDVDQSKRQPYCRKHLKGSLKQERIELRPREQL